MGRTAGHPEATLRQAWQRDVGPLLSEATASMALAASPQRINELIAERRLLQVRDATGHRLFPLLAQESASSPSIEALLIPGLAEVLHALALGESDPWMWALWLSGRLPKHGGWCAAEALAGGEKDLVLRRSRNEDWVWTVRL